MRSPGTCAAAGACAARADQVLVTRGVAGGPAADRRRPAAAGRPGRAWRSRATRRPGRCSPRTAPGWCRAGWTRTAWWWTSCRPGCGWSTPRPRISTRSGGRLPVPRRQALAAWARATGALIVEDDYDGEFRYDVAPAADAVRPGPRGRHLPGHHVEDADPGARCGLAAGPGRSGRGARRDGRRPGREGARAGAARGDSSCWPTATWTGTSGGCGMSTPGGAAR